MKYILLMLFTLSLFFAGCSKKSGNNKTKPAGKFSVDTTDINTKAVANPDEAFNLAYKFEQGKQYRYRLSSHTHDVQTLKMDSSLTKELDRSLIYIINLNQSSEEKDGIRVFDCKVTSIKLDESINGKKYKFESGPNMDSTQIAEFGEFYSMLNTPFNVKIGPNGGVEDIYNVDKILDKFLKTRKNKSKFNQMQLLKLKNGLKTSILKPIVAQIFRKMPAKSVAKDSTWDVQRPPARYMVFSISNSDSYKIKSLGLYNNDKLAVIGAGLKTDIKGKTNLVQNGVRYNFKKPETSTSGEIYFNLSKGCIQKSKIKSKLHMFFEMEGMTSKGEKKRSDEENENTTNIVELL